MLILKLPRRQWSLPLVGEEKDDGMRWRSSQCPSLGCLDLGVERRPRNGMEWNDHLPLPRSNLIPYITR